jgi:hypothetical protein
MRLHLRPVLGTFRSIAVHAPFGRLEVVSIEVASMKGLEGNRTWLDFVESAAIDEDGRPHWGQINHLSESHVLTLYGGNLIRWREALLSVSGTSTLFSNNYTRQRGLEPAGILRKVVRTGKVGKGGRQEIRRLCGADDARWGPAKVKEAIAQIEAGSIIYFTNVNGAFALFRRRE